MPKPNKRGALAILTKKRLMRLARQFELDVRSSHPKPEFVEVLAGSKKASFAAILGALNLGELRDICRAHDLDGSAKDRATLEARILGTAAKPKAKPGKSKKAAKTKPRKAKQATSKAEQLGLQLPPDPNKSPAKRARRTMAIKKSELYSSLWASCDELRGGMDASQYKDYVLVLLFVKYVSDKYADVKYPPITIPKGASFADMVELKGKPDIGDKINKQILAPLKKANPSLSAMPDFNDPTKLGSGKEMVQRLTNLVAIFENPALDFSSNRADGDDILGDAYEYLMRHFATDSGKSKGQFYTPAEVSRVIAQVIGIREAKTSKRTTVYDPTCGSGSLLLKVGDAASSDLTLYGQEKDSATAGLAYMNMVLHDNGDASIKQGNTLANPLFVDERGLKTFDFVVANPPFSDKRWSTGLKPSEDRYERFKHYGVPPGKQGDYAYLLHIVRSLKSEGKGACILPHGVLFRGNAEAAIREKLVLKGFIKGIIGLPANLFFGTGIPACIVVLDKQGAAKRKSVFMVDASKGFMKDGNKNRLREMDIHKIVDVFIRQVDVPKYARMVSLEEIEGNEFNLNIPRYIDSQEAEDVQDIEAHLRGGIPVADIDALGEYWAVCPGLRKALFKKVRKGYVELRVDKSELKATIHGHPEFAKFIADMEAVFEDWRGGAEKRLKGLEPGFKPKALIRELSESLLGHYEGKPLIKHYDVYQHLMDYWHETMQDDCYLIAAEGWKAEPYRIIVKDKKGKEKDKGWACDLVPKELVVARYFAEEQAALERLRGELEAAAAERTELEEEHSGDEGLLSEFERINKGSVKARLKEIKGDAEAEDEETILMRWVMLSDAEAAAKKAIKAEDHTLDEAAYARYDELSQRDVKELVLKSKWSQILADAAHQEVKSVSQLLAARVEDLVDRYRVPLPVATNRAVDLETKVRGHLDKMGFRWP